MYEYNHFAKEIYPKLTTSKDGQLFSLELDK